MANLETTSIFSHTETGVPFASGSQALPRLQHLLGLLTVEAQVPLLSPKAAFFGDCPCLGASLHLPMCALT